MKPQAGWWVGIFFFFKTVASLWGGGAKSQGGGGAEQPLSGRTQAGASEKQVQAMESPSLQKLYYHGEPLSVNVHVTNNSAKTVKKIRVSGRRWGGHGLGEGRPCLQGACAALSAQAIPSVGELPGRKEFSLFEDGAGALVFIIEGLLARGRRWGCAAPQWGSRRVVWSCGAVIVYTSPKTPWSPAPQ